MKKQRMWDAPVRDAREKLIRGQWQAESGISVRRGESLT